MKCPYPACSGEVESQASLGYRKACKLPVFSCLTCHAHNRNCSHFCRKCRGPLTFPLARSREPANQKKYDLAHESRRISINEPFWLRPMPYRGLLWGLSANGNLYPMSPFRDDATLFASIEFGFGKCPFVIRDIVPRSQGDPPRVCMEH